MSRLAVPNEILLEICRHLPFDDVTSSLLVCRRFRDVILSNWKHMQKISVELLINFNPTRPEFSITIRTTTGAYFYIYVKFETSADDPGQKRTRIFVKDVYLHKQSKMSRMFFHHLKQKENQNVDLEYNNEIRTKFLTDAKLVYQKERNQKELAKLVELIVETFNVKKLHVEDITTTFPHLFDYMLECFESLDSQKARNIPIYPRNVTARYVQVYKALKSELVHISSNDADLLLLDTNYSEIQIRNQDLNINTIGNFIEEWDQNHRNIRKFSIERDRSVAVWEFTIENLKVFMSQFRSCFIEFETEIEIKFNLQRRGDRKILVIHFECNEREQQEHHQHLRLEEKI